MSASYLAMEYSRGTRSSHVFRGTELQASPLPKGHLVYTNGNPPLNPKIFFFCETFHVFSDVKIENGMRSLSREKQSSIVMAIYEVPTERNGVSAQ